MKQVTDEIPLIDGGLNMGSINVLEPISTIEEKFGVTVRDEDMSADLFGPIAGLSAYVRKQLEEFGEEQRCNVSTDH